MSLVFGGDSSNGSHGDCFRVEDDPSDEIVIYSSFSGDVSLLRYKDGPLCIIGTQYHWELGMVDPSSLPVYFRLGCSKPWIAEDCFLFPEFREIEPEVSVVGPGLNLEVSVEVELSAFIFRPVNI